MWLYNKTWLAIACYQINLMAYQIIPYLIASPCQAIARVQTRPDSSIVTTPE